MTKRLLAPLLLSLMLVACGGGETPATPDAAPAPAAIIRKTRSRVSSSTPARPAASTSHSQPAFASIHSMRALPSVSGARTGLPRVDV